MKYMHDLIEELNYTAQNILDPPIQQMLDDPKLGAAGLGIGYILVYTAVNTRGQIKAEDEITELSQDEIYERRKELAAEIKSDSIFKKAYNILTKPKIEGELSVYRETDESYLDYTDRVEDPEYFNQLYTDEKLKKLKDTDKTDKVHEEHS